MMLHGKMFRNPERLRPSVNHVEQMASDEPCSQPWHLQLPVSSVSKLQEFPWGLEELARAQSADPALSALYRHLQGDDALPGDGELLNPFPLPHFSVINSLVYYNAKCGEKGTQPQLCLPTTLQPQALKFCHETLTGHGGIAKTQYALRQCFYWATSHKDIVKFIQMCLVCQSIKPGPKDQVLAGKGYLPVLPFDCLAIDLVSTGRKTPRGNLYVLVAVDLVSRYAWFLPAKSREAPHLAGLLVKGIFDHWGLPKFLMSDRAGEFTSKHFTSVLKELEVRHHKATPYNPQSNSVVERMNRTLLQLLRGMLVEFNSQWDDLLPWCARCYNGAFHRSINNTPYYLMFMRDARIPYEAILPAVSHDEGTATDMAAKAARCLELARTAIAGTQDSRMDKANLMRKLTFEIGDIVYARQVHVNKRDFKLLPKFYGPFRIMDLKGPNTAIIKSFRTGRMLDVSLRNIKLIHHEWMTKTDHPSVLDVFPCKQDADLPVDVEGVSEVKSHGDLVRGDQDDIMHPNLIFEDAAMDEALGLGSQKPPAFLTREEGRPLTIADEQEASLGTTVPVGDHPVDGPLTRRQKSTRVKDHPVDGTGNPTDGPATRTRSRQVASLNWLLEGQ